MNPLFMYQATAFVLLAAGLCGLVRRKTLVGMLISVELMLNGAGLAIAAAGQLTAMSAAQAQICTLFVMGLAAAEATIILGIIVVVFRRIGTTETSKLKKLRN